MKSYSSVIIALHIAFVILTSGCAGNMQNTPVLDNLIPVSPEVAFYQGTDYTAFQAGDVRVYFSYWFPIGYSGFEEETRETLKNFYQQCLNEIGVYFRAGLITGDMFYENYRGLRQLSSVESSGTEVDYDFQSTLSEDLNAFDGHKLKIVDFEEETDLESAPFVRMYHLWVQVDKEGEDWGSIDHYLLLVTLPNGADKDYVTRYSDAMLMSLEYSRE